MLQRELEPELMDDPQESQAYDEMGHDLVNQQFVTDFLAECTAGPHVLDLGTGTARIPIELCRQNPDCLVLASDAAVSMLDIAKLNIAIEGFEHRIDLHHGDSKSLEFDDEVFDAVISNSLLHHLAEPQKAIAEMLRVAKPGGRIFVRDLMRPATDTLVEDLVSTYAGDETPDCQQLFRQSLKAALTVDEFAEMVAAEGVSADSVKATSDRHITWSCTKQER